MRELPILMNGAMVRAVLDGRKTVTRRLVKLRHPWEIEETDDGSKWPWHPDYVTGGEWDGWAQCPYGEVGDRLYVRETWIEDPEDDGAWGYIQHMHCKGSRLSDIPKRFQNPDHCLYRANWDGSALLWRPSIHMPKWAARIWLEVTDVRVERLQDITTEQILAEGIASQLREHDAVVDLRQQLEALWDGLAKPGTRWADNPWVWVVEFKRVEGAPA